ncbi:hypothetical protein [Oceanobacillus kimchii]|uniref:Serine protease n=1 Tax=Oceanobacillus kimchii TaxID=746691 RepID=A0ABQ5TH86_9BACI|nr:hypothetical protein [Oceanobacillus kimchii]GLO66233.1 hypothetical protein MACH08_20170 [Oceanobacillus kimchii]
MKYSKLKNELELLEVKQRQELDLLKMKQEKELEDLRQTCTHTYEDGQLAKKDKGGWDYLNSYVECEICKMKV